MEGQGKKAAALPQAKVRRRRRPRQKGNVNGDRKRSRAHSQGALAGNHSRPVGANITDADIVQSTYKFIRDDDRTADDTYETRLARRYDDTLFKEYCLGDFSRYKRGQIGLRWRTLEEVKEGKGQQICGNAACHVSSSAERLSSYEVPFRYFEHGVSKEALVKLRVCPACAFKLNYKRINKLVDDVESGDDSSSSSSGSDRGRKRPAQQVHIRNETDADVKGIAEVTIAAFETLDISDKTEQYIIAALRTAGALAVSLVAERDGCLVGHIAFSPVSISDGTQRWYGLGPVSVLPKCHGQGIGTALVQEGLSRLKSMGARGCCLVGQPEFYSKSGFRNVSGLVYLGAPEKYFLALSFDDTFPQGEVTFHEGFNATE